MSALETHEEGGGIVSEVTQTPARYEALFDKQES